MAIYKSAISFGLVHIPVDITPVIKNNDTSFNLLHKKCGSRIKYIKYCSNCKKEISNSDIIKGYKYNSEDYVTFDESDFKKIKADGDKIIDIISFVDLKEIDPVYFEKSYYLSTNSKNKAFSLFHQAMKKVGKVAIAKTILGNKSFYVILRFGRKNIIMSTLYYDEEINLQEEIVQMEYTKQEMELALQLIASMEGTFEPGKYHDEYQDSIKKAIRQKVAGLEIKPAKNKQKKTITDLMSALEESIKSKRKA